MTSSLDQDGVDTWISQRDALAHWNSVTADNAGMLGGYGHVSRIDLQTSSTFLTKLLRRRRGGAPQQPSPDSPSSPTSTSLPFSRAVDCGAGIGRITTGLLSKVASTVDVVEPVRKFTDALQHSARGSPALAARLGRVHNVGLEAWTPDRAYDLFWNQWCLGQLTDAQTASYLSRCRRRLARGGWIVVKENLSTDPDGEDLFDGEDSSVTRSDDKWRALFVEAGLEIVGTELQRGFPKELFPVRMYALRPMREDEDES